MRQILAAFIILILLVVVYVVLDLINPYRQIPAGGIACTLEAKECLDGSYVGRTGPKCEFSPCPRD